LIALKSYLVEAINRHPIGSRAKEREGEGDNTIKWSKVRGIGFWSIVLSIYKNATAHFREKKKKPNLKTLKK
jgi:hypothetical protein